MDKKRPTLDEAAKFLGTLMKSLNEFETAYLSALEIHLGRKLDDDHLLEFGEQQFCLNDLANITLCLNRKRRDVDVHSKVAVKPKDWDYNTIMEVLPKAMTILEDLKLPFVQPPFSIDIAPFTGDPAPILHDIK